MNEALLDLLKRNSWNGGLEHLEVIVANELGKGWGTGSIQHEVACCLSFVTPNVVIDIGANKGLYTEQLLARLPNAQYHLFEPAQANVVVLDEKFSTMPNVTVHRFALSNNDSSSTLYADTPGSGLASLTKRRLDHFNIHMTCEETIQTKRFDCVWTDSEALIDYVKIDVEGHELDVLEGFGELIAKVKLIQFEFGGCNIDTRTFFQDFWYFFTQRNFKLYRISPIGIIPITRYSEYDEFFSTTNYIAVNHDLI